MIVKIKINDSAEFDSFIKIMQKQQYQTRNIEELYRAFMLKPPKYVIAFLKQKEITLQRVDSDLVKNNLIDLSTYISSVKLKTQRLLHIKSFAKLKQSKVLAVWTKDNVNYVLVTSSIEERYHHKLISELCLIDGRYYNLMNTVAFLQDAFIAKKLMNDIVSHAHYQSYNFHRVLLKWNDIDMTDTKAVQKFLIKNI